MQRVASFLTAGVLAVMAPLPALANCLGLPAEALVPGSLYARMLQRDGPKGDWIDAQMLQLRTPALLARSLRFVHVVAFDTGGGVVAVRQRNEVRGQGKDTQVVHIERPAVREACLPGKQKALAEEVSANTYKDYHDDLDRKHSDLLYRFHFKYKTENANECRRTDDTSIEGRTHFRYDLPLNVGQSTLRGANIEDAAAPQLFRALFATIGQALSAQANALTHPASVAPELPTYLGDRHYVYLRTMLRRYPVAREGKASCISFDIDARDDVQATTISVTDLSDPSSISAFKTKTWTILWNANDTP